MGFAILRTAKLKHAASVRRSLKHAFREQDTPNADPARADQNTHLGAASVAEAMAKAEALWPEKRRKDAVLVVEYLVTGSPEDLKGKTRQQQDAYFADALDWLRERHGAQNVVYAGIHRDEHTPHLYAYVVPLDAATGRLNAKKWLGGAKALTEMQTEFAERVGKAHGLERGIEGSKARHQTVRQFYAGIEAVEKPRGKLRADFVQPREVGRKWLGLVPVRETPQQVAERIDAGYQQLYAPIATAAGAVVSERKRAKEATETAKAQVAKVEEGKRAKQTLAEFVGELTPDQLAEVAQLAKTHRQRNRVEAEATRRADQLAQLVRRATGAALTFCEKALAAIKDKAGSWRSVDWPTVERAAAREAVHENGQPRVEAVRAVLELSPGQAGTDAKTAETMLTRAAIDDREHGLQPPKPERDGPSLSR